MQEELRAAIGETFASKTLAEWTEILEGSDTCTSPTLDVMQSAEHPQVKARDALFMRDGVAHTYTPFKMGERIEYAPAPHLGEHTAEILSSVGYSDAEIEDLRGKGIL